MQVIQAAAVGVMVALVFAVLILAKNLIIPMVLALFIWYLINILTEGISSIKFGKLRMPQPLAFAAALIVTLGVFGLLTNLISLSVNEVVRAAPSYQANIDNLLIQIGEWLGLETAPQLSQLWGDYRLTNLVQLLAGTAASFLGSSGLILIYILFLFLEQKFFRPKIEKLFPNEKQKRDVQIIINQIYRDTRTYIGIKTLTSISTGFISYMIMTFVGLDFALFWGLLIFLLNYIPTIGSIIATFFPSILALVQFPTIGPFLVIVISVTCVQIIVGNIIEPRLLGNTLNLSPLVILLSLALWGTIWGIPGAILCVPITVLVTIIFSRFDSTRFVAIMLSREGQIRAQVEDTC
jgi:predicted PurR-regulated permease PerM